jgi:hypothetical protein
MRDDLRKLVKMMLEAEELTPASAERQREILATRKLSMEKLSQQLANKLKLSDVRYLSRSKRPQGAYTFSAVDERNDNVVLKIQPRNELGGYLRMQRLASRLPPEVSRHLPIILKVRTLEGLRITLPDDDPISLEELGVILMERLEELPGNMFDLITEPPARSAQSLSALLSDQDALRWTAEKAVHLSLPTINQVMKKFPDMSINVITQDLLERFNRIHEKSKKLVKPLGNDAEEFEKVRNEIALIMDQWLDDNGINDRGSRQTLSRTVESNFASILTSRAIARNPAKSKPGSLSRLPGIRELQGAMEALQRIGVKLDDVHGNNIMMRPETGELVLADLGHFS